MSTLQRRFFRHDGDAGDIRELHSFLTCRLIHSIPFSARERLMTYRSGCEQRFGMSASRKAHTESGAATERSSSARLSDFSLHHAGSEAGGFAGHYTGPEFRELAARFARPDVAGFAHGFEAELFAFWDTVLGSSPGPGWLRHPRIADAAQQALHAIDGVLCSIDAFVILPTHVHLTFSQRFGLREGPTPAHVAAAFKAPVQHQANRFLGLAGMIWEEEDYHRYLPGPSDVRRAVSFIREDPVRSGLVEKPEEWEWLYVRGG